MCDYSLHAMASRPAKVGETLVTTTFPRTSTRGFAAEGRPPHRVQRPGLDAMMKAVNAKEFYLGECKSP
jgi:hypothetical protein